MIKNFNAYWIHFNSLHQVITWSSSSFWIILIVLLSHSHVSRNITLYEAEAFLGSLVLGCVLQFKSSSYVINISSWPKAYVCIEVLFRIWLIRWIVKVNEFLEGISKKVLLFIFWPYSRIHMKLLSTFLNFQISTNLKLFSFEHNGLTWPNFVTAEVDVEYQSESIQFKTWM